mgnify:CR=1 FL=1
MSGQCRLVAVSALGRKNETVIYAKVGEFPVSELIQVFGRLISCQQIIIINVNGLVCMGICFSYQYIEKSFIVEKISDGVVLTGL